MIAWKIKVRKHFPQVPEVVCVFLKTVPIRMLYTSLVGMPLCVHWTLDMGTCRMSNFCLSITDMEGLSKSVDGYVSKPLLYYAFDNANFEVSELLEYGIDMTNQDWLLDTEYLPKGLRATPASDHNYSYLPD